MQSKTSYFSKTLFFKNITRFWPIWAAYLMVCLYRLPLQLYMSLNAQATDVTDWDAFRLSQLEGTVHTALMPFPFFLFACITAIAVFSYLYQSRSTNMIHSLPVCRESLFITNVLSGICFLIIPQMIAFLAGIFVCFLQHMMQLEYLMHWLILSTGMVIFAFALAVFAVMITGNIIAAPIFFLIINFLFVACRTIISSFIEALSFGIRSTGFDFGSFLSPYYFLSQHLGDYFTAHYFSYPYNTYEVSLPEMYGYIGGYFIASIPIFILAFVIYKRKHLETTGDIITLSFLKPLFRWGFAFCLGSCVALSGYSFFTPESRAGNNLLPILILMVIGGILAFFLADMLLQKKFFVFSKKKGLECGIFLALSLVFIVGVDLNMFGTETRIPEKEDIQSIFLYGSYPIAVREEDFDTVLTIHQDLIDSKDEFEGYFRKYSENSCSTTLELSYTMKNGSVLTRSYSIPVEDYYLSQEDYVFNQIDELSQDPEYYLRYHFTNAYESITFVDGSLDVYTGGDYLDSVSLNQAQCMEIYEAFKQDVREGNYRIYNYATQNRNGDRVYYNGLYFTFSVPEGSTYISYSGLDIVPRTDMLQGTNINLTTDCVHTLQILEEMDFLNENHQMITQKEADMLYNDTTYEDVEVYH